MSVREEDAPKNSSTSRGLGLAAAAIGVGVGVGAALYYFFSKRPENPDTEGSTSQWQIEQPHEFRKRSWSLEECTICYEVMLKDQELMTLPCAHNFHSACIAPWLRQQQTCPNCRNAIH